MIIFLVLTSVLIAAYYFLTQHHNNWIKKSVAGPKPNFFFGNLKEVILKHQSVNIWFHDLYDAYPKEKVVGLYRMRAPQLLVRDPDIIQHIMIKDFDNFTSRATGEFGSTGLSQNLFMTSGEKWRVLRKRLSPIFTSGKLKNMFHLINDNGDKFIKHISVILSKAPEQDAHQLVQKYTVSTISACVFGVDIDLDTYDTEKYSKIDQFIFDTKYVAEIGFLFPGIIDKLNIPVFQPYITNHFNDIARVNLQVERILWI
jgi:cytochrome P450 family 6